MAAQSKIICVPLVVLVVALGACNREAQTPANTVEQPPTTEAAVDATAVVAETPPTAEAPIVKYEGKIVRRPPGAGGKEDGWYLVKDGKRRWISDSAWLEANGYKPEDVIDITEQEFVEIPEDPIPVDAADPASAAN